MKPGRGVAGRGRNRDESELGAGQPGDRLTAESTPTHGSIIAMAAHGADHSPEHAASPLGSLTSSLSASSGTPVVRGGAARSHHMRPTLTGGVLASTDPVSLGTRPGDDGEVIQTDRRFVVGRPGQNIMRDLLRQTLRRYTRLSPNALAHYTLDRDLFSEGAVEPTPMSRVMSAWGRRSVFMCEGLEYPIDGRTYTFNVYAFCLRPNDVGHMGGDLRWFDYHAAYRVVGHSETVSLVRDVDTRPVMDLVNRVVGGTMAGILARPTEFSQSRGQRTSHERLRSEPAIVTISLSLPRRISVPSPDFPHGGGWRMPEHDVRGHWRCAEHRRSVLGCTHVPVLRDGDHAICERCLRLIVWVPEHQRGDAGVRRRTVVRVTP